MVFATKSNRMIDDLSDDIYFSVKSINNLVDRFIPVLEHSEFPQRSMVVEAFGIATQLASHCGSYKTQMGLLKRGLSRELNISESKIAMDKDIELSLVSCELMKSFGEKEFSPSFGFIPVSYLRDACASVDFDLIGLIREIYEHMKGDIEAKKNTLLLRLVNKIRLEALPSVVADYQFDMLGKHHQKEIRAIKDISLKCFKDLSFFKKRHEVSFGVNAMIDGSGMLDIEVYDSESENYCLPRGALEAKALLLIDEFVDGSNKCIKAEKFDSFGKLSSGEKALITVAMNMGFSNLSENETHILNVSIARMNESKQIIVDVVSEILESLNSNTIEHYLEKYTNQEKTKSATHNAESYHLGA